MIESSNAMVSTSVPNFYGAPVYYIAKTDSTMIESRRIVSTHPVLDGTVVYAGLQSNGRGRIDGRVWKSEQNENLLCTVILDTPYESGFTLKIGLAVANTVKFFLPTAIPVQIKWPNDILVNEKKICGILCESDGRYLYTGIGCNVLQKKFAPEITEKAISIACCCPDSPPSVESVLELLLKNIYLVMHDDDWIPKVDELLYKRNCVVQFAPGTSSSVLTGVLTGINGDGALIITGSNTVPQLYYSGELLVY